MILWLLQRGPTRGPRMTQHPLPPGHGPMPSGQHNTPSKQFPLQQTPRQHSVCCRGQHSPSHTMFPAGQQFPHESQGRSQQTSLQANPGQVSSGGLGGSGTGGPEYPRRAASASRCTTPRPPSPTSALSTDRRDPARPISFAIPSNRWSSITRPLENKRYSVEDGYPQSSPPHTERQSART
jgi:hypothetical protein